ncbi:LysE family translocator [Psychrobium sp. 1_MG-2023]|uniref:LysE family translocator n=1 Tax=Psychrobium sp. 1_MG-2023 TaxID=3062624 RepID=UPI000C34ADB3|nr:LysE family translocator [Psychrobium sp. 1_MG-2023]MDP2561035.1 LysE family translocator [Psychrobium sp. 1_MG-2023]PKF58328.1 LysE family translocator [Alteromonadales bacterium alter-6D02]
MISIESLISFFTISIILAVSPGPSNAFLMAQTFAKGKSAGIASAAGFATAGVIHTIFAVLGLSAILKTSPQAYQAVLYLGAAYLVYLGVMAIKDSFTQTVDSDTVTVDKKSKSVFSQALLTEVLNPKVALFFIAFIPQFVDPSLDTPSMVQMAIFGLLYPIFALPIDLSYVHFGDKIAGYFRHHPSAQLWLDRISGVIFISLACSLLL